MQHLQWKKYLRPAIAVLLLLALFKFKFIDIDQLAHSLKNPFILTSGLVMFTLQALVFAWRWQTLVQLETNYTYLNSIKDCLIGNFFNFFIPSGVGGDIMKALAVAENKRLSKKITFSLVTIDRVLGLFCLILFSTVFLTIEFIQGMPDALIKYLYVSIVFLVLACFGVLFLHQSKKIIPQIKLRLNYKILEKLYNFAEQIQINIEKALSAKCFLKIIFISFIGQCLSIGFLYIVTTLITHETISFFLFLPLACFAFMASAVPITPAGIGVGQFAFNLIFTTAISAEVATAVTSSISLMQIFTLMLSLPGGYFFATAKKHIASV